MTSDPKSLNPGSLFCQYAGVRCAETFSATKEKVLFLYPSVPTIIASTIEASADILSKKHTNKSFLTWKDLRVEGRIVFCEICKAIFTSSFIIGDITTLNFNLLFEIGYIFGLGKPLIPIFDTSFGTERNRLNKIGLLDNVGYKDFVNSQNLAEIVENGTPSINLPRTAHIDTFHPIYYLKTPLDIEGSLRISSSLKKSYFRFRVHDPKERFRLPLNDAVKEIDKSLAVVVHLLSPDRGEIALIHNARCAFVAGFAMASQKRVLMVQEGRVESPIDYRDLIKEYQEVDQINVIMATFFRELVDAFQSPVKTVASAQRSVLEEIDIGDIAAENEIENLKRYYVRSGQFTDARKGHGQLVVGRKGSGKTALFYALRHHIGMDRLSTLILDLKPEGYQFAKLREKILQKFSPAVRQHTLTAIWDYVLLLELAHKIINDRKEQNAAYRDQEKWKIWEGIKSEYALHRDIEEGDFSERLDKLIEGIIQRTPNSESVITSPDITQIVFKQNIQKLRELIVDYLEDKEEVWVLFDNLDKNWKISTGDDYEAIILRCLLDASRKLQKMLVKEDINFHSVIFVRNDIYTFFLDKTTDRGKDQVIYLNWEDVDLFKEMFRLRISDSLETKESLDTIWTEIFDIHVQSESSFNYIIDRTLLRPRDFLLFIHYSLQTAINRGHNRVSADDIMQAEEAYSRDLLEGLIYEIRDIAPELENVLYSFIESERTLYENQLVKILEAEGIPQEKIHDTIHLLLWFCFIGIFSSDMNERYAYSEGYDIKKLLKLSDWVKKENSDRIFCIHPGFSKVLELKSSK